MNRSKIVIISLTVLALAFGLSIGLSGLNLHRNDEITADDYAQRGQFPEWISTIGDLVVPFGPRVKQLPPLIEIDPLSQSNKRILIKPATASFRVASFKLVSGQRIKIDYQDQSTNAETYELEAQSFSLPKEQGRNRQSGSIVILSEGGQLTLTCYGHQVCQVQLN